MSLIGENYFCTYYRWTVGEDLPPLVAGSILFTADEGTIKKTCGHMAIFFGQSIHKNCFNPDLVDGNSSLMHSAILLEGKVEDGTYWLQMAEATISDGIVRNWENMDLILDERQADSLYLVIPKSESLRNRIVELGKYTTSETKETISYSRIGALFSVFSFHRKMAKDEEFKVAGIVTDTLQERQWRDTSSQPLSEFCSSYVLNVVQASLLLEAIPQKLTCLLKRLPRESAIQSIIKLFYASSIPNQLSLPAHLVEPSELYHRLVSFPK